MKKPSAKAKAPHCLYRFVYCVMLVHMFILVTMRGLCLWVAVLVAMASPGCSKGSLCLRAKGPQVSGWTYRLHRV